MKTILLILLCLVAGCSLLPQKKTQEAAFRTTENMTAQQNTTLEKIVKGQPQQPTPQFTISGSSNSVSVSMPPSPVPYSEEVKMTSETSQTAGATDLGKSKLSVSLPLGVSMILTAIGILAILFAIYMIRRSSAAANAAYEATDSVLANRIKSIREQAITATEHKDIAIFQTRIASLESERGRMLAKRK